LVLFFPHVKEFRYISLILQDNELLVELPVAPVLIRPVHVVLVSEREPVKVLPEETFPVFSIKVFQEVLLTFLIPFIEIIRNTLVVFFINNSLLFESPGGPVFKSPLFDIFNILKTAPVEFLPGDTLPVSRVKP